MRADEFVTERKKKKRKRSNKYFGGYWYPGYGYYGSGAYGGESGDGGGDGGGGESVTEDKTSKVLFIGNDTAIVGQEHGKRLQLSDSDAERVQAIAQRYGAWYEGNGMDRELTKGIIDNYKGSWDDDLLSPAIKGYPAPFLYVLFSNIKENDTVEGKIGFDPDSTIFDRILDTQPSTNYFPDREFDAETLQKFLESVSEGPYDFVEMSQAPATESNVRKFFTMGEQLMFPNSWEEYPYRAGRVAKSVNDLRDKFLATRKQGVYVAGSDHLKAVQQFLDQNKQDVNEAVIGPDDLVDVYIRGQHRGETVTRLVARAFPNKNIPLLIRKLETKYGVNPDAVVYGPSQIQNENFAECLDEAVGGNYLYHATSADGLKGILSSDSIRSATGPQAATSAQTKLPTVSVTRDWGYASGAQAQSQLGGVGRDAILVLDRDAVESNFKTLGTSQSTNIKGLAFNPYLKKDGEARSQNTDQMARTNAKAKAKYAEPTAKAGGEFEEAVVVPKGALPLKGTMVGFWVNPDSELMKDPAIMNDPRRLDMIRPNQLVKANQTQGVAENFADGKVKGKSRPGRVKRSGASCKGSVSELRARAKKYGGERGQMYHWCANMKSGRKK